MENRGKWQRPIPDVVGKTFGHWTVLELAGFDEKNKNRRVHAKCRCGLTKTVLLFLLKNGESTSCGCMREVKVRHGGAHLPEYNSWCGLMGRCYNKNNRKWPRYGGRGIVVCARWQEPNGRGFANFLADMGPKPSPQHSIDRINNDGNYEPGNVRWATCKQQSRNMSRNRILTVGDVTMTVTEWAEKSGLSIGAIRNRLERGLSDADAVNPNRRPRQIQETNS